MHCFNHRHHCMEWVYAFLHVWKTHHLGPSREIVRLWAIMKCEFPNSPKKNNNNKKNPEFLTDCQGFPDFKRFPRDFQKNKKRLKNIK